MRSIIEDCCGPEILKIVDFHETLKHFKSGDNIFTAGQKVEGLYFIKSGKVKVTREAEKGQERIVRLARDGMILGHRGFDGNWHYPVSAVALTD